MELLLIYTNTNKNDVWQEGMVYGMNDCAILPSMWLDSEEVYYRNEKDVAYD